VLAVNSGWTICGEASEPLSLVLALKDLRPDVVLIDLASPQPLLMEAIRQAREISHTTEVVCLVGAEPERVLREGWAAGARGFVLKAKFDNHLLLAVEAVTMHKPYVEPDLAVQVVPGLLVGAQQAGANHRTPHLTPREREIVQLVADGRTSKEIAATLSLSPKTVEAHRASILKKLNIRSASQMVLHAVRNNIIPA
jgi:DNA-binding NarL/FixJ family response regulator